MPPRFAGIKRVAARLRKPFTREGRAARGIMKDMENYGSANVVNSLKGRITRANLPDAVKTALLKECNARTQLLYLKEMRDKGTLTAKAAATVAKLYGEALDGLPANRITAVEALRKKLGVHV